ncbi:uncharacterized protein [Aegilops tauschii subsp. strangulata]|uniref:uncharacterized protein isoform X2 n=1 Tax=Aegilops tauschii subsp. strangulata TaxID=200361 RepID=UPI003CC83C56
MQTPLDGTSIGDEQDGANKPRRRRSSIRSSSCSWRNNSESLLLLCCPGVAIHSSRGVAEPLLRLQPPSDAGLSCFFVSIRTKKSEEE